MLKVKKITVKTPGSLLVVVPKFMIDYQWGCVPGDKLSVMYDSLLKIIIVVPTDRKDKLHGFLEVSRSEVTLNNTATVHIPTGISKGDWGLKPGDEIEVSVNEKYMSVEA